MGQYHLPGRSRQLIAVGVVLFLLYWLQAADVLSTVTTTLVSMVLGLSGIPTQVTENGLYLGDLIVPWTKDCSGFEMLAVVWALIFWNHRSQPLHLSTLLRLLLALPAALAANVLRVLAIIGWRNHLGTESLELHALIGFVCLLPLILAFRPQRRSEQPPLTLMESTHFAAALALLAPMTQAPGGLLVSACALIFLALPQRDGEGQDSKLRGTPSLLLWVLAGLFIAFSSMESLWLGWILLCPRVPTRQFPALSLLSLIAGTSPLIALSFPWIALPGLIHGLYALIRPVHGATSSLGRVSSLPLNRAVANAMVGVAFFLPFVAPALFPRAAHCLPPNGIMVGDLGRQSYALKLVGQPPEIALTWHGSGSGGRHHHLGVCLSYRGVSLRATDTECVERTSTDQWVRECFFVQDSQALSYTDYLRATFWPLAHPGAHLIVSSPCEALTADEFGVLSEKFIERVRDLHLRGAASSG